MFLLIIFAFLAGIITVLSPCILPILPIVLSSSIGGNISKTRPIGIVTGFILSFTFFTLFLSTLVNLTGISADTLRFISVIIITVFGISLLIPQFQLLLEKLFSNLSRFTPQTQNKTGFLPGVLIGLSIGLLWTPCVGPILASVITLAITGTVTLNAFLITLAYSLGTAMPMFAIMIGGQTLLRKLPWLLNNSARIQKGFGIIMILTALAIANNYDRAFQTYILNVFPQYGTGLTKFEENTNITNALNNLKNNTNTKDINPSKKNIGKPTYNILNPKGPSAPELIQGGIWLNSNPLTLSELKGKVVIIDFWTYSCINCQRTLPYLKKWFATYRNKGLVIIGVHSPEFEFEKSQNNLTQAIKDFEIKYPVMQDNDFSTWRAYDNHFWPAKYIIDKDGYIRYTHFGEGAYDETEKIIQKLLLETGRSDISIPIKNQPSKNYALTPESYLGYARINRLVSPEKLAKDTPSFYTSPPDLTDNALGLTGKWQIMSEYANPQNNSSLLLNFEAQEVYLVMRVKDQKPGKLKVLIDGKTQYFGSDNQNGIVTVTQDRLYKLIKLPNPGRHILKLEFQTDNLEVYAFTFG